MNDWGLDEPKPTYQSEIGSVKLTLDSYNKIFQIKYHSEIDSFKPSFEEIKSLLQDQSLESCEQLLLKYLLENKNWEQQQVAMQYYFALEILHGKLQVPTQIGELICRCTGVTINEFEQLVIEHLGHPEAIKKESNIALICSDCESEFKNYLCHFANEHKFFYGELNSTVKNKINDLLEEFPMYAPEMFNTAVLKCHDLRYPQVIVHCSGINSEEKEMAENTLTNYLAREMKLSLEVCLIFDSETSNHETEVC